MKWESRTREGDNRHAIGKFVSHSTLISTLGVERCDLPFLPLNFNTFDTADGTHDLSAGVQSAIDQLCLFILILNITKIMSTRIY